MKLIYETWNYWCAGCGRFCWSARIPAKHDPVAARPVECGKCQGHKFRWEREAA